MPSFSSFNKYSKSGALFQDESCVSFFRRLCFSPDGSLLFMPVGLDRLGRPALHVATRNALNSPTPMFTLAGFDKPVIAIRCCPLLFEKCQAKDEESSQTCFISLPYRILIAVMTMDRVYIFDTEHKEPIWCVSGLHYAALTDISWSCDGRFLIVTSVDGFCSLLELEPMDIGSCPLSSQSDTIASIQNSLLSRGGSTPQLDNAPPSSDPDLVFSDAPCIGNAINQLIPKKRSLLSEAVE